MSEIQMCECCGYDEPAIQYNEREGHMCKDCLKSWENSHQCEVCYVWQDDPCYEGKCEYCQRMYEGECEVLENGWKQVLEDCDDGYDLENFAGAAKKWECCAVGEILGFPSHVDTHRITWEIKDLGDRFWNAVDDGSLKEAADVYKMIQEYKEEILKIKG